jgi:TMEM175 potassium channel family protein
MSGTASPGPDVGRHSGHSISAQHMEDPSLARIGAFSDGVFAFAITLLILAIRIPYPTDADANQGLLALLTHQWRSYLAFVLSFMLVGINWAHHRVMFATFSRANHGLVWLNLLYLMVGVAFMPIPTAVLGAWLGSPNNQVVAAVFYGGTATIGGLIYNLMWWYGAYIAKLTSPALTAPERRSHTIAWGPAPFVVAILTAVAFANPPLAVAGYVATVFVYVLPVPRLVALRRQRRVQSDHQGKPEL